jgi:hypothetical protein
MKIIRTIVVVGFPAAICWLFFLVVPTLGVFRSAFADQPVHENGYALVLFEHGKGTNALFLKSVATGWPAVGQGWPLIIIGAMLGYPFGEYARRKFAIDQASKEAIEMSEKYANDAYTSERNADNMIKMAQALHTDMPRLQNELAEARKEIMGLNSCEENLLRNYADLRRRKESVEKELTKAKAKIKRLSEKNNSRIGKTVDATRLSE